MSAGTFDMARLLSHPLRCEAELRGGAFPSWSLGTRTAQPRPVNFLRHCPIPALKFPADLIDSHQIDSRTRFPPQACRLPTRLPAQSALPRTGRRLRKTSFTTKPVGLDWGERCLVLNFRATQCCSGQIGQDRETCRRRGKGSSVATK